LVLPHLRSPPLGRSPFQKGGVAFPAQQGSKGAAERMRSLRSSAPRSLGSLPKTKVSPGLRRFYRRARESTRSDRVRRLPPVSHVAQWSVITPREVRLSGDRSPSPADLQGKRSTPTP
jgi:hypothetical protein